MVAITEPAGALLQRLQIEAALPNPLRIVTADDGFVVGVTPPAADDEVLYYEGTPVLRIAADASAALAGCTIATQDTPEGPVLTILVSEGLVEDDEDEDEDD